MGIRKTNRIFTLIVSAIGAYAFYFVASISYLLYWDSRVTQLCLEQGGTTVYKQMELSESEAIEFGLMKSGRLELRSQRRPSSGELRFYSNRISEEIKSGSPTVIRMTTQAIDSSDGEVLGEFVSFGRRGGPSLPLGEQSSLTCNGVDGFEYSFEDQIFVIKE